MASPAASSWPPAPSFRPAPSSRWSPTATSRTSPPTRRWRYFGGPTIELRRGKTMLCAPVLEHPRRPSAYHQVLSRAMTTPLWALSPRWSSALYDRAVLAALGIRPELDWTAYEVSSK